MKELRKVSQEELQKILELHKLWLESNRKEGTRANLSYANLRYSDLSNANLRYCDLRYADLANANLGYIDLSDSDLRCADLFYAILEGTDLSDANLSGANLSNAKLTNANLTNAILEGVDLSYADLYKTNLFYTKVDNMIGINNVGNENRTVYYFYKEDRVICGCFDNTLEEFKKAVAEKYGEDYGSYAIAIEVFEKMNKLQKLAIKY